MIIDCADLPDDTTIDIDVCVVGAGPAGLSIASAFDGSDVRVAVIEAGGLPGSPAGLDTPTATMSDSDFEAPLQVPARFGGAANEWIVRLPKMRRGVRMLRLSPEDLDDRTWVPHSGWPVEWLELCRWYTEAEEFLGLEARDFSLRQWADATHPSMDLEPSGFTTGVELMADPRLFTHTLREQLASSKNVDVYLGARAGEFSGHADRAVGVSLDHGRRDRLRATAKYFVIACGGVENARLLLEARGGAGFGASNRNTGAYYVDHHRVITGVFAPADPDFFARAALYDLTHRHGAHVMGKVVPTANLRSEHELLHSGAMLLPKPTAEVAGGIDDLRRFAKEPWRGINEPVRALRSAASFARAGAQMAVRQRRLRPYVDAGWSGLQRSSVFAHFMLESQIELAPDPANRLILGPPAGPFGRRSAQMTWRWNEADITSLQRTTRLLGKAVADRGLGTLIPTAWDEDPEVTTPNGAFHPSGTTRMSNSSSAGVVDGDGLVHGSSNVFVAGSSTFPTAGYANPTLTVVALARRLAAHLQQLAGGEVVVH